MQASSRHHRRGDFKGRLFLIDGSSFFYRAFYAIKTLSTSRGQPTNAIYGVVTMLKKLLEEENPEYLAVALDTPKPTFRHLAYERYKEHRPSMPQELVSQLPWIKEVLKAFRIPIFELEGFEADDILGTLSSGAAQAGAEVFLVTGDKDALQLVGERVKVYKPTREGHEIMDREALRERWNVAPEQVVDVMALMGDEIDAIPGVPGIGEKTAVELIQKFGSVEKLLAFLEKPQSLSTGAAPMMRPGLAQKIREHKEQLQLSRQLALLDTHLPLKATLEDLKRQEPDRPALLELFQKLEFRSLAAQMRAPGSQSAVSVEVAESADRLTPLLWEIRKAGRVAMAVSATSEHPMEAEILSVGLSWKPGSAWAISAGAALQSLRALWEDKQVVKICPSLKEALVLFGRAAIPLTPPWQDPSLASYLLDPARPSHRVSALSESMLGESIADSDPSRVAALEAEAALRLAPLLEEQIEEKGLRPLLLEVEIPLSRALARMEESGIAVDPKELEVLHVTMNRTLQRLTKEIYELAGQEFNINSPKQLSEILFAKLKLPVIKRTKTGASTDEEVLRRLSAQHALPATILEYREMFKLSSTYVEALPRLIHPTTGRIHTSFNQTVTATGRLSSSNPNLQNIPIRTELGRQIRRAFVPASKRNLFLAADYSQIELRILAHLSQDEPLLAAFRQGQDIHRVTAADVFHVKPDAVSNEQRSAAKTINFGIVYGMTPFGLAKELGVNPVEAEQFIERYFARYPGVRQYLTRCLQETRSRGYCMTLFQRRRYIPEISAKDISVRQFAERTAVNAPIQGSAADLIKVAMVALDHAIGSQGLGSRMLLQVHDELVFEVPPDELEKMRRLVTEIMEAPPFLGKPFRLSVAIEVKLSVGANWLEVSHA